MNKIILGILVVLAIPCFATDSSALYEQALEQYGKQNYSAALKMYEEAASANNAMAMAKIGEMYYNGNGVEINYNIAASWFIKGANLGNSSSQFYLGNLYRNGDGVEKDLKKSLQYYKLAAENNHTISKYNLGLMYLKGYGTESNYSEALKWFRLAALDGDERAIKRLNTLGEKTQAN